ncbi:MAG: hypothetical protein F6K30_19765, partial [Cyanothece sp. SIO2G6]|nr:hypothetical protein [Cyanothece sp. SIO2G6]
MNRKQEQEQASTADQFSTVANLSVEQKRQLLAQLLAKKKQGQHQDLQDTSTTVAQASQPPKASQFFPVSFAQQRLWFIEQLQPGSTAYHLPAAFRVTGTLNVIALEASFNTLIQRHEILRTRITTVDEQPMQGVAETQSLTLLVEEIPAEEIPAEERENQQHQDRVIQTVIQSEATRPFDLAEGPLLR